MGLQYIPVQKPSSLPPKMIFSSFPVVRQNLLLTHPFWPKFCPFCICFTLLTSVFPLYHLYFLLILSHFLLISLPPFDIFSLKWHHPYSPRGIFQYIGTQLFFLHVLLILSLFQISPSPCLMISVNIFPLTRVGRRGFSKILTFVSIWGVSAGISHSWIFLEIGGREHEKYCLKYGWFPRLWEEGGGEGGCCQEQSQADHHPAQPAGRVFLLSDTHPSGSPGTASILTYFSLLCSVVDSALLFQIQLI
jgi:hypothetical protein